MIPWIEAIATRTRVYPIERYRLVALARGAEKLTAEWDRRNDRLFDAHGGPTDYMKGVDDCATELRRLLEEKP